MRTDRLLQLHAAGVIDKGGLPHIDGLSMLERSAAGDPSALVVGDIRSKSPAVTRVLDALGLGGRGTRGRTPREATSLPSASTSTPAASPMPLVDNLPDAVADPVSDVIDYARDNPWKTTFGVATAGYLVKRWMGW